MKNLFSLLAFFLLTPLSVHADEPPQEWLRNIRFYHEISTFHLPLQDHPEFFEKKTETLIDGKKVILDEIQACHFEGFLDEDEGSSQNKSMSPEVTEKQASVWELNEKEVRLFLEEYIIPQINREPQEVRIYRDEEDGVQFEGAGRMGKTLDIEKTVTLLNTAIRKGVDRIELPIIEIKPTVTVDAEDLKEMGIQELLAVGESDFSGSTWARMHNIEVGAEKFNGKLFPQGETISFNNNLGAVNSTEGYLPELVILGQKVEKEYGGGLCQVSSTTYRAALLSGLPIVERYPHSFAVHYYEPWGTDATIYLGGKDLKFQNDTPGALLVQTTMNRETKKLRFHFYGTPDNREVKMFSGDITNRRSPLAAKHETTTDLPPGSFKRLSSAVSGFDTSWVRVIIPPEQKRQSTEADAPEQQVQSKEQDPLIDTIFSRYQPRGDWTVRGIEEKKENTTN